MPQRIKGFITNPDILIIAIILLTATASFALGRLSVAPQKPPVEIVTASVFDGVQSHEQEGGEEEATDSQGLYVGSQNSDKYHLPWCSGAQRINENNKVWFDSKQEAEAAGYSPAGNCRGI